MSDKNYKHIFIWSSGLHIETDLKKSIEDLEHLQGVVGGFIEQSQGRYDGKNYTMWVNEEGLLHNLPVNQKATKAYQDYWFWYENENPGTTDRTRIEQTKIVGNVVLIYEQGQ
jgi:hypothetical protein